MTNYLISKNSATLDISNTSLGIYVSRARLSEAYPYIRDFPLQNYIFGVGLNDRGQLGLNDLTRRSSPTILGGRANWSSIDSSSLTTFATKSDGTLWGWGANDYGQIGDNTSNFLAGKSSPVQIGANTNWLIVETGGYSTFAIKTDGTLWSWGHNYNGQLGYGPASFTFGSLSNNKSSPTQIGTDNKWISVKAPDFFHLAWATKSDGTLWTWGSGRSSPTQVGSSTNWTKITGAYGSAVAGIQKDGTLWIWGPNLYGFFGDSTGDYYAFRSTPVQIGTDNTWKQVIFDGQTGAHAIKTDGTLWAWAGSFLNVPPGNAAAYSSPVQIGTAKNWAKLIEPTMAIKTDGTLWGWDSVEPFVGALYGNAPVSSPVLFGSATNSDWGRNWISVSTSASGLIGIKDETFFD